MSSIESHIEDRFKDLEIHSPEKQSAIWESVAGELDSGKRKKRPVIFFRYFLVSLLLIGLVSFPYFLIEDNGFPISKNDIDTIKLTGQNPIENPSQINHNALSLNANTNESPAADVREESFTSIEEQSDIIDPEVLSGENQVSKARSTAAIRKDDVQREEVKQNPEDAIAFLDGKDDSPMNDRNKSKMDSDELNTENTIAILPPVYIESNPALNFIKERNQIPSLEFDFSEKPYETAGRLEFLTGVNNSKLRYSSASDSDRNSYENSEWGYTFGLAFNKALSSNWTYSAGLELNQYRTKFDYSKYEEYQELRDNQLIEVNINGGTGDTVSTVYGEGLVDIERQRNVIHYNHFQMLSIPLLFGYENHKNRLNYSMSAGPVLGFSISQSGRRLSDTEEVVDFDKNKEQMLPKTSIGWRVKSSLSYMGKGNLGLHFSPALGGQIQDSPVGDSSTHLLTWYLNAGLVYRLK